MKTTQYHIYLSVGVDEKTGKRFKCRRYYQKKLSKKEQKDLIYVGKADLTKHYFIVGSEPHIFDIDSLEDIELEYTAYLKSGRKSTFKMTLQERLERAKEGILPYLSFKEHRVAKKPTILFKGQKTLDL